MCCSPPSADSRPQRGRERMLIDSHVNLHAPQFADDVDEVIARARQAGVGLMVTICDKVSSFEAVHAIAMAHDDIWCTVGTHPHEAKENPDLTVQTLMALAQRPKVIGIGECGLDFHYDLSPRQVQAQVFRTHVHAAQATGLPLVVHTREADEAMAQILEQEFAKTPFKLLMHCYTSGPDLARRAAALGAWFSVSGIATFKAAEEVRAVIAQMPEDRIIVETDCPYLAPAPLRGRRNEPAYVGYVLAKLADIRGWSVEEAERRTQDAFFALFDAVRRPADVSGAA
ncbi:MAG TPA: TatD family hydrolase [Caulobacteraceae bacterium]|nr:TatD family hydrolase [Caulobacteraceae bacterium]